MEKVKYNILNFKLYYIIQGKNMKKSKVLISGFVITTLIVGATINLIFSNKTMKKAEMKNE